MKIIISPAKKMISTQDDFTFENIPCFLNEANKLNKYLSGLNRCELYSVLKCNDKILELNYKRYKSNNLNKNLSMALTTYVGLQYQHMAPHLFTVDEWEYVNQHLYILSGLYGLLKPNDGIVNYRLEMQAKINYKNFDNLYDFWGDKIAKKLCEDTDFILNLASKEYSEIVEKYATTRVVTCVFGILENDKIKVKGTLAKMARGEMVRYLATNNIDNIEDIKQFNDNGFEYSMLYSSENELVFIKYLD